MLTYEKCKQVLKIENEEISEDEIAVFRDMLYAIAQTAVETYLKNEDAHENSSDHVPGELG
jgi:hypothetical protein